jgi:hypothetical protein
MGRLTEGLDNWLDNDGLLLLLLSEGLDFLDGLLLLGLDGNDLLLRDLCRTLVQAPQRS